MKIFKKNPQTRRLPGTIVAADTGSIGEGSIVEGERRPPKSANNGEPGASEARADSSSTADPPKFHSGMAEKTARATAISKVKLWEAFTPARPKQVERFFAGRRDALQRMITAIQEDHAHVIIYGPRGIGKTSLANIFTESATHAEYRVLRYPCSTGTKFTEIFRGFLKNLPSDYMDRQTQAKYSGIDNFEQLLPSGDFGPTELSEALGHLKLEHAILIVDEFDRVASGEMKRNLVEAMKNLSDNSAQVTLIIIGIARSLEELLGIHPSIQRHLVGIHLPLMEASELRSMILTAEEACSLPLDDATRDMIVSFSRGLPYYAQLLALHACRPTGAFPFKIGCRDVRP